MTWDTCHYMYPISSRLAYCNSYCMTCNEFRTMQQRWVTCYHSFMQHGISAQSHSFNNYTGCLCSSEIFNGKLQFSSYNFFKQILFPDRLRYCSNYFQCLNLICIPVFFHIFESLLWYNVRFENVIFVFFPSTLNNDDVTSLIISLTVPLYPLLCL